jgi:hypothetical protein
MDDQELNRRFDGIAELVRNVTNDLSGEMNRRFDKLESDVALANNRLERIELRMTGMEITLTGVQRFHDQLGQSLAKSLGTQTAAQRAFDELAARVKRLEDERKAS